MKREALLRQALLDAEHGIAALAHTSVVNKRVDDFTSQREQMVARRHQLVGVVDVGPPENKGIIEVGKRPKAFENLTRVQGCIRLDPTVRQLVDVPSSRDRPSLRGGPGGAVRDRR